MQTPTLTLTSGVVHKLFWTLSRRAKIFLIYIKECLQLTPMEGHYHIWTYNVKILKVNQDTLSREETLRFCICLTS